MTTGVLDRLEVLLEEEAGRALDEAASEAPGEFRRILDRARESAAVRMDLCLASCAAAAWAGADPALGLPGAVAAHLIDSAVACHITLPGFSLGLQNEALWPEFDEASAILAGDALFPAAIGYLSSRCGLKSVRLAGMAASLLCAGVPIIESLADLRDSLDNPRFREVLADLIESVEGGKTLSQAMASGKPPLLRPSHHPN